MNNQPGRLLTREDQPRKRKDRETLPNLVTTTSFNNNNKLLAGYLAFEFLTRGTLFGQMFDPAQAVAGSASDLSEPKRLRLSRSDEAEPGGRVEPDKESYAEVASLLKSDGAHIGGLVNPTQLARWIQM